MSIDSPSSTKLVPPHDSKDVLPVKKGRNDCFNLSDEIPRIGASTCILVVSWIVLHQACHRSATIYFFEMDSTTILFMSRIPALILPFALAIVLYFVYHATRRSAEVDRERKMASEAEKELRVSSSFNSRKVSRETSRRASFSTTNNDDNLEQQQQLRIRRLLSDIEEQDVESTIKSVRKRLQEEPDIVESMNESNEGDDIVDEEEEENPPEMKIRSRFVVENVDDGNKIILPPESSNVSTPERSRSGSVNKNDLVRAGRKLSHQNNMTSPSLKSSRTSSFCRSPSDRKLILCGDDVSEQCDIYKKFADTDIFSYSLSVLSLVPKPNDGPRVYVQFNFVDLVAELFAVHLPIWACVVCVYVILLEFFSQNLSFYFYYHEETMMYFGLIISLCLGVFHEVYKNWITNDILAFSSIYVICSRVQAISYQTGFVFVVGMIAYDLFFFYVVDMLRKVTKENPAPLIILLPCDGNGNKESVATLDIMVPGIFLNVILKYGAMFDSNLFYLTFTAVFCTLVFEMVWTVWRSKNIPVMVLPGLVAIGVSLGFASNTEDLWRFMIKH